MWKAALFVTAYTCVSVIRTFKYVTLSALSTLLAIANGAEGSTSGCSGVDRNVGIAAVWVGAVATKEVSASRDTVRGGFMGKVASITSSATASSKELLAHGDLVRIMRIAAAVSVGAHTCEKESVKIRKAYQRTC